MVAIAQNGRLTKIGMKPISLGLNQIVSGGDNVLLWDTIIYD